VVIDGYTQPGLRANTALLGSGDNAILAIHLNGGLTMAGTGQTLRGLAILNFNYGILIGTKGYTGNTVSGCFIGTDGTIEDLHVLSGPAILAAAAQQAVREWHFKPVVQNGQRVETMAKIVVNFSIRVADNSEKTTLAESRADGLLIFSR